MNKQISIGIMLMMVAVVLSGCNGLPGPVIDTDGDGVPDNEDDCPFNKNKWELIPLPFEVTSKDRYDELDILGLNWITKAWVEVKNLGAIPGTFTLNVHIRTAERDYNISETGYIEPGEKKKIYVELDLHWGEDSSWSYVIDAPMDRCEG